jgi:hypothetical protein
LRAILLRNRQRAEREVQLRVPFTVIIEAVDQLKADELRLLAHNGLRSGRQICSIEQPDSMAQVPSRFGQTRHNADVPDPNPPQGNIGDHPAQRGRSVGGGHGCWSEHGLRECIERELSRCFHQLETDDRERL